MKKLLKRIMALSLCACMMMGAAAPVNAAGPATTYGSPANAVHWLNSGDSRGYMNAYKWTPEEVVAGTKVTNYAYDNSTTQKFYTSSGKIKSAANTNLSIAEVFDSNYGASAYLMLTNYGNNSFSIQAYGNGYRVLTSDGGAVLAAIASMNSSVPLSFATASYTPINQTVWTLH